MAGCLAPPHEVVIGPFVCPHCGGSFLVVDDGTGLTDVAYGYSGMTRYRGPIYDILGRSIPYAHWYIGNHIDAANKCWKGIEIINGRITRAMMLPKKSDGEKA